MTSAHVVRQVDRGFDWDLLSLGGTEKSLGMRALASISDFPQHIHMQAPLARDIPPYPYCFSRELPIA